MADKFSNKSGTVSVEGYKALHPDAPEKSIEAINKANTPKTAPNSSDAGR